MVTLVGISGSLRKGSYNSALLRAAAGLMPRRRRAEHRDDPRHSAVRRRCRSHRGHPGAGCRAEGRDRRGGWVAARHPEYNNSIPGVFKNAIDWLSRPPADIARVFGGKPVALIGASPGGFGTILSQSAWLPVLRTLGAQLWSEGRLLVSRAPSVFAADGTLTDAKTEDALRKLLEGFVRFVESQPHR